MDDETVLVTSQEPAQSTPEKTLTVEHVNEIVKREKTLAAEKVRKEMEALHAKELEKLRSNTPVNQGEIQSREEEIEQRIMDKLIAKAKEADEHAERIAYQQELQSKADKYFDKMNLGKEKYQDFDEVMTGFNPKDFHEVVFLAADLDNTPDVMYELSKNPFKLATLNHLATRSPEMARRELMKLSQSISTNEQAKANHVTANEPLSSLKSSVTGVDNGQMSLKDFKNASWLRG